MLPWGVLFKHIADPLPACPPYISTTGTELSCFAATAFDGSSRKSWPSAYWDRSMPEFYWDYIGVIYRDNGKENGNY